MERKDLKIQYILEEDDLVFHDVRKPPFAIYGLYRPETEPQFKRLPDEVGTKVSPGVAFQCTNTAGGRIRFSTDSRYVCIRAFMPDVVKMPHMSALAIGGFDLYVDGADGRGSRFHRAFVPPAEIDGGYEMAVYFDDRRPRNITIHMPTYANVQDLFIGVSADATLGEGGRYRDILPVVFYGSSITQGACASRPGLAYENVISRRLGVDHINLGFSGSALAEETIVNYMATLPMSAFVSDYDHNAPNAEHLRNTHYNLYRAIRDAHPHIPYIMISSPSFTCWPHEEMAARRDVVIDSYRRARAEGDTNVWYIDGESFFRGPWEDDCTVDSSHPNDLGMAFMADAIGCVLAKVLGNLS